MMLFRLYIYDQKVLLPKVAETEEGFYVDMKPIEQFDVRDRLGWKERLTESLINGNTVIPTPEPSEAGGSALLEYLHLQKWMAFEKKAVMYTIHKGTSYIKLYRTGKASDGMWGTNGATERVFHSRAPLHHIIDALAEDVIKQPEAHPVKVGGLMLRPPS